MTRSLLSLLAGLAGVLLCLIPIVGHGGVVDAKLSSGKMASANFQAGNKGQPAVLILHGFLQTRDFPTVTSTAGALSVAGFTTLAPTLSLGISQRNKSLPCEAVHLHKLDDDVAEIAFWVRWLRQKGHSRIILVGHSFGNLQLLAYLKRTPTPAVKQVLMISLTDVEVKQSAQERDLLVKKMRERVAGKDKRLAEAEFGYCRKYVSPPAAMLSYLSISRDNILDSLSRTKVPVEVIVGGKDDRMGADWVEKMISRGIVVRVIPGASHFFDNQYEFDLQEAVLKAVDDRLPGR